MNVSFSNAQIENKEAWSLRVPLIHLQGLDFMTPRLGIEYQFRNSKSFIAFEGGMPIRVLTADIPSKGYFFSAQWTSLTFSRDGYGDFDSRFGIRVSKLKAVYNDYLRYERSLNGFTYNEYSLSQVHKDRLRIGLVSVNRFKLYGRLFAEYQLEFGYSKMEVDFPETSVQVNFYNGLLSRKKFYEGPYLGGGFNLIYHLN
ncbi:MAG: hypothetical protein IT245_07770 [Bacteroidia bacterium]|nr:hypothetical protein [Bacteroidia bacterium]